MQISSTYPSPATHLTLKGPAWLVLVFLCAFGIVFNLWIALAQTNRPGTDFNQFYATSRLAGTGHLYDWSALRKIEERNGEIEPTGRLPVVAFAEKIIGRFPYSKARWIWLVFSFAALAIACAVWPGARGFPMALSVAWSMPVALILFFGQDDPFWLMFFGLGLLLLHKNKPAAAGIAFSLCLCKYHLAVGLPVMLLAQRRFRAVVAGAVAVSMLLAACFLIEGIDWPLHYLAMLKMSLFSPAPERMPCLFGLTSRLPGGNYLEALSFVLVLGLLCIICRKTTDIGLAGAFTAAAGLLLAHHSYGYDCALLIPLSTCLLLRPNTPVWLKACAILTLSPIPVIFLCSSHPLIGQLIVCGFTSSALLLVARPFVRSPAPAPSPHSPSLQIAPTSF